MARVRKNSADAWMPPRVYRGKSAYEFHPKNGGAIRLCALDAAQSSVWSTYEALINEIPDDKLLASLAERFFKSADFFELARETQRDYLKYSKNVLAVFGAMPSDAIRPEHVRKYMDRRGLKSRVQANREKAFMSRMYRWGYERGMVKGNPTKGVKKFKETSRDRYVTDAEYQALYSCAPDIVKIAMELAYLTCSRQGDVLAMKKSQIMDEGVLIKQSKTSVAQIKAWSPRFAAAIKMASGLPLKPGMSSIFILHQPNGSGYTRDGFNSRWSAAREAAKLKFPELLFDFTFHDLKAKGVSDLEGDLYEKRAITGHKNVEQTAAYDRKIVVVPVVGGQAKGKKY